MKNWFSFITIMWMLLCFVLQAAAYDIPFKKVVHLRQFGKIVGGTEAEPGEFPYQVSIKDTSYRNPFHFCGGTIISPEWIVTAAHCMTGENPLKPTNLVIVAGEHRLSDRSEDEQTRNVTRIVKHRKYNKRVRYSNDIALLRLDSPLNFTDYVSSALLQNTTLNLTETCTVTGWGTLSSGGCRPDTLQKVDVPLITEEECKDAYSGSKITEKMVCAGDTLYGGVDSCQGDSGGPLFCDGFLAGIVSWGYSCASPDYPGVYTEVSYYTDWIETQIDKVLAEDDKMGREELLTSSGDNSDSTIFPEPTELLETTDESSVSS